MMTKRIGLALVAFIALALLVLPAAAVVNVIAQGGDVFIGEQGLNVTAATGGFTQIAWFASGTNPNTDVPNSVISVGDANSFYIAPSNFVGKTGNWYRWDGSNQGVAFNVNDPNIALKVWDQNSQKDVSGKAVPAGNIENFRIESNLYTIAQRPGYNASTDGQITIKVKTSDGAVYTALYQTTTISTPLTKVNLNSQPFYWVSTAPLVGAETPYAGWNTGAVDQLNARIYKAGVYTCWAECNVNHMKDNYKDPSGNDYTGKTVSATTTLTIATDTVKIEASKDTVVRGNPFSVTVTGRPNSYYYLWVKGTGQMTGLENDMPPFIVQDQSSVNQNPPAGSYTATTIGDYQYEGGNGRTIAQDVPANWDGVASGTYYYAYILTSDSGTRTIGWMTTADTKDQKYTIKVEQQLSPGVYKNDEVDVTVEKGTVTIVAAGDQNYFMGQEVQLSGTDSETDNVYLFITGPNLPSAGGRLTDPRTPVVDGVAATFDTADVQEDNTWSFKWQTANLNIDAGTYTVYAVATPNNRDNLGNTQYGTVSIIIRKPFVAATASQSVVAAGDKFYIDGTAEGQPSPGVAIWILGVNFVNYSTVSVNSDSTFSKEVNEGTTANMAAGQYFVVVQHPMYNDIFDVYPNSAPFVYGGQTYAPYDLVLGSYPVVNSVLFKLQGPGSLQGSDAANALVEALNNPSVDDTYTKLQFMVEAPTIRINPIGEQQVGSKFTISGTTNLAVDDEILVEVVSSSFAPTTKTQSGEFSGATGTVKVQKGTDGFNTWSFPVDAATFKPDEYIVTVSGITVSQSASALFNVVEVTPTPTATPTAPPTTVVTTVPTTVPPTPTPTPTTPGFGALVALIGLGAVAFLIVRKH
jgi:PGF-CTERM protein